jgi:hypothetical protein
VRQGLLACASAAYDARPLPEEIDWQGLLEAADRHGLIPLVSRHVQASACPEAVRRAFRGHARISALRTARMEGALATLLASLTASGVPAIVLKGPALAWNVYPSPWLRPYRDLDLLCREEHWEAIHELLVAHGYAPALPAVESPPPMAWERKARYHVQYDRAADHLRVEIHFDLWWYGLRLRMEERVWTRSVSTAIAGAAARTLTLEDQLLELCVHLHHHGYSRLIWFTDLACLLRCPDGIDWDYVVASARDEGVGVSVYYSLLFLDRLLGVAAPRAVMAALRPAWVQSWLHDRLWPPSDILGVDVRDRVLADFHEVPEAEELLWNLVLGGRRGEKLTYLGHLLLPPAAWLARFYGTTDPMALSRRRLVHAPKLLASTLAGMERTMRFGPARRPL